MTKTIFGPGVGYEREGERDFSQHQKTKLAVEFLSCSSLKLVLQEKRQHNKKERVATRELVLL